MNEPDRPASIVVCPSCGATARPAMVTVGDQLRTVRWVCAGCAREWNITEPDTPARVRSPQDDVFDPRLISDIGHR